MTRDHEWRQRLKKGRDEIEAETKRKHQEDIQKIIAMTYSNMGGEDSMASRSLTSPAIGGAVRAISNELGSSSTRLSRNNPMKSSVGSLPPRQSFVELISVSSSNEEDYGDSSSSEVVITGTRTRSPPRRNDVSESESSHQPPPLPPPVKKRKAPAKWPATGPQKTTNIKYKYCPICGHQTQRDGAREKHIRSKHPDKSGAKPVTKRPTKIKF